MNVCYVQQSADEYKEGNGGASNSLQQLCVSLKRLSDKICVSGVINNLRVRDLSADVAESLSSLMESHDPTPHVCSTTVTIKVNYTSRSLYISAMS